MTNFMKSIGRFLNDNSPAILTGIGVAGTVGTTVLAVRATPRALRDIMDEESQRVEELTWQEKVRLTWVHYVPATATGLATISAIVGAQSINQRRQAALMGVYALTETAFREYREKTVEHVGERDEQKIRDQIAMDSIENNPSVGSQIIMTGNGEHLCYDKLTGRYFKSDMEKVRKAVNDINEECLNNMYASQNDFYRLIGLPPVEMGEEQGWRYDNTMEVNFVSHIDPGSGQPALAIDYVTTPKRNYHKINA